MLIIGIIVKRETIVKYSTQICEINLIRVNIVSAVPSFAIQAHNSPFNCMTMEVTTLSQSAPARTTS
jgi:hypothetical protein